jgi:hypothetical protein
MSRTNDIWSYSTDRVAELAGFSVYGRDGLAGKIDGTSADVSPSALVVHVRRWCSAKKVVLPPGVVVGIDFESRIVFVDRDKASVSAAPAFDPNTQRRGDGRTLTAICDEDTAVLPIP